MIVLYKINVLDYCNNIIYLKKIKIKSIGSYRDQITKYN